MSLWFDCVVWYRELEADLTLAHGWGLSSGEASSALVLWLLLRATGLPCTPINGKPYSSVCRFWGANESPEHSPFSALCIAQTDISLCP